MAEKRDPFTMSDRGTICDPDDAPDGYYAVPKGPRWEGDSENICRQCDWRPTCQDPKTDTLTPRLNCRGYAVRAFKDGKIYRRADGCGVVFKKRKET
jgi:hypothetical protein